MGLFSRNSSSNSQAETARANLAADFQAAERVSKERDAKFWEDYERRNGPGSVDWSGGA
jgi:hypothetical protein